MKRIVQMMRDNETIKYLFFGGLTTLVNLFCFYVFTEWLKWNIDASNVLSIIIAILFAYATNTRYVFQSKCNFLTERFFEFMRFILARVVTMLLEIVGVHIMVIVLPFHAMVSKSIMQVIVVVLNYIFSKFVVYKN